MYCGRYLRSSKWKLMTWGCRKMLRKHELKKHVHLLPKKAQPVRIPASAVPQLTVTPNAARSALHAQADP